MLTRLATKTRENVDRGNRATNVGSITQTFRPDDAIEKGMKGYFRFGGSATMTLFEPGRVSFPMTCFITLPIHRTLCEDG